MFSSVTSDRGHDLHNFQSLWDLYVVLFYWLRQNLLWLRLASNLLYSWAGLELLVLLPPLLRGWEYIQVCTTTPSYNNTEKYFCMYLFLC